MLKRSEVFGMAMLVLVAAMLFSPPQASSQEFPGKGTTVATFPIDIWRGTDQGTSATYTNSTIDTAWVYTESADYLIDSVQFSIGTPDTARYRTALLFRNDAITRGSTTVVPEYSSYVLSAGATAPVDTGSSTTPMLNGARVQTFLDPGARVIGYVIQFSAAGNHVGIARIAAWKYTVWCKAFYRWKK